ncbi:SusC/RagA family TonB-linked outer membrane protein [Algibacter mikhailovii]|uniref:SusC/RagA family TonB-linked outer membrane protein n=1 Tax=Algibacter mikhailovii TaxID=425498 RepID=A0A918VBI5_9FLAO|nr:TonB-dependent receptor [Algibacter mikhailovii]GGZ86137.1 SusC/RagA family TonB-linked outer membrane protein [Algibacter mikhailovii]
MKNLLKLTRSENTFLSFDIKIKLSLLALFAILTGHANANSNIFTSNILDVYTVNLQQTVTGVVTDTNGQPLAGATVIEKGTNNGVSTDFDGNFSINLNNPEAILEVSYVGFVSIEIIASKAATITLTEDLSELEAVVVVGYGTKKREDLTGSISSVSAKSFEKQPLIQASDAIQGRAAGVSVTKISGAPGATPKIRIRGSNSLTGSSDPLVVIDGFFGSVADLDELNPNDIQSIDVLKDATGTAMYGSRGANGVIAVTTVKGVSEKPTVSFNTFYGMQSLPNQLDVLSGGDYAREVNKFENAKGGAPLFTEAEITQLDANGGSKWQDQIYRNAPTSNYQLSVRGKSGKTGYFISGNYADQDGIIVNTGFKRYNLRSNIDFKISEKISARLNLTGSRRETLNTGRRQGLNSPVTQAVIFDQTAPPYQPDGSVTRTGRPGVGSQLGLAPLVPLLGVEAKGIANIFNANASITYNILPVLTYNFTGAVRLQNIRNTGFSEEFASSTGDRASSSFGFTDLTSTQFIHALQYTRAIDKHQFTIKGIYEEVVDANKRTGGEARVLPFPDLGIHNLGTAEDVNTSVSSSYSKRVIQSIVGRLDYTYNNKYLFTASLRSDSSSAFAPEQQQEYFPSAALGWKLSEEQFIKDLGVFSNLKLRGSWGVTGNQGVQPDVWRGTINAGTGEIIALNNTSVIPTIAPGQAPNPDLKWEKTAQLNVGLDASFFNNRLSITADYYRKETTDALLQISVPAFTGQTTILKNIGAIENKGFEFGANAFILDGGDFTWDANFNIAFNKTKVLDLGGQDVAAPGASFGGGESNGPAVLLEVGKEVGNFQGFVYQGVYQSGDDIPEGFVPGDSKFKGAESAGGAVGVIETIGNGQPDYIWGLTNNFGYKGIDLSIFLQSMGGFDVWNLTRGYTYGGISDVFHASTPDIRNQWNPENPNSNIPHYSSSNLNKLQSSRWIEDGTFVRIKNISLGYNLPSKILEKTKLFTALKFYISAQNLVTFTKYNGFDPEISASSNAADIDQSIDWGAYPNPKTFTFGINAKF